MSLIALYQKPKGIGKVTVTTPGTPVSLAANFIGSIMTVDDTLNVNKIALWAPPSAAPSGWTGPTNTQTIYIGDKTMNKTTLAGVVATIVPGGSWSITNNVGDNVYALQNLYVDADHAGDSVYGNVDQA